MKNIFWSKWKIARSGWPYKEGWGTYRQHFITSKKIILDTGLSKEQAIKEANILNKKRE
jgi:hypothetical protein